MGDSLHLSSPAGYSSLPGRLMPAQPGEPYPDARHVVDYLADYEQRYGLPVRHGTRVRSVRREAGALRRCGQAVAGGVSSLPMAARTDGSTR